MYENEDIKHMQYSEYLHGGKFFSVKVDTPYEDMDLVYHVLRNDKLTANSPIGKRAIHTIPYQTPDYSREHNKIIELMMKKIGFEF